MTTLIVLALALSMDSFAAALSEGSASRPRATVARALAIGFAFGAAQGIMPLVGFGLGVAFTSVVREVDHWIAFVLLTGLGLRMVREGLKGSKSQADAPARPRGAWPLMVTAVATSVDAAAAGVTLPVLDQPILLACAVIGAVTFALSTLGVLIGAAVGVLVGQRATILGGFVLVGIGSKILVEHLFFGA